MLRRERRLNEGTSCSAGKVHTALLCTLCLWAGADASFPECPWRPKDCLYGINPQFGDVMEDFARGERASIAHNTDRQNAFCNFDSWKMRSESCGTCPYSFEFTSGVPAELRGVSLCLSVVGKVPSNDASLMHLGHRYNNREMRVVSSISGYSHDTADFAEQDLADTIVFSLSPTTVARQLNNTLLIQSNPARFFLHRSLQSNAPPISAVEAKGVEDVVMFKCREDDPFLSPVRTLRENRGATVMGKVRFRCHADPRTADLLPYGGGSCPMDSPAPEICASQPDIANRLCAECPVVLQDPATGSTLGCVWEPALLPQRAYNNLASLGLPIAERVVVVDGGMQINHEMCTADYWGQWRGRIVVAVITGISCPGPFLAAFAQKAGVKALVTAMPSSRLNGNSLHLRIPMGSIFNATEVALVREWMQRFPTGQPGVFEADALFLRPPPKVWLPTPAPPVVLRPVLTVEEEHSMLMQEPSAVVGVVLVPVFFAALAALVWRLRGVVPSRGARGVSLALGSTMLALCLGVTLTVVTYVLTVTAGRAAESAQRNSKRDIVSLMDARDEDTKMNLTMEYMKKSAQAFFHRADALQGQLRLKGDTYRYGASFGDAERSYDNWLSRMRVFHRLRVPNQVSGLAVQVIMRDGYYYDDFSLENHPFLRVNGSTLKETGRPWDYPLAVKIWGWFLTVSPRVYNPFKRLFWHELPSVYDTVMDFDRLDNQGGSPEGRLHVSFLQVTPPTAHWVSPYRERVSPYISLALSVPGDNGLVVVSLTLQEVSRFIGRSFSDDILPSSIGDDTTYAWYLNTGLLVASNHGKHPQWKTVGNLGDWGAPRFAFQCFSLFDSPSWELNAMAHFLLDQYGRLDAKDPGGKGVLVRSFSPAGYLREHRTEALWLGLDGSADDLSWHRWDTWAVCPSGGTACLRYVPGRGGGQALHFDGTAEVRVSPYLTRRVPHVVDIRAAGGAGATDYYNASIAFGGVPDVVAGLSSWSLNPRRDQWVAAEREKLFRQNDYSVSVWIRRDTLSTRGVVITDSFGIDANMRLYADGQIVVSRLRYGCRTAPLDVPVGRWVFVVATMRFTRSQVLGQCGVYIDGVRRAWALAARLMELKLVEGTNMTVGSSFTGSLQDLRVHNRSLSPENVMQLMRTGDARVLPSVNERLWIAVYTHGSLAHKGNPVFSFATVVPQSKILQGVRQNQAEVSELMARQDRNSEEQLDRQFEATLIIVSVLLLGGAVLFTALNNYLTQPFAQFAVKILRVSQADVEGIEALAEDVSLLQEINVMAAAINTLVVNMREYKTFMPEAIFAREAHHIDLDAHEAPGLDSGCAAVVFTDIQGSTALWEACPDGMSVGLRVHNAVMREQIAAYGGYEVKTIGDAFMVAFPDLDSAADFALATQEALVSADWPASLLELPTCTRDMDTGYCGVRVRMGVNFGDVNVELNEVLQRYDYFGPTVNRAARLEAQGVGGGVVVDSAVVDGVGAMREGRAAVLPLGNCTLKGIAEQAPLSLLVPFSLKQRTAYIRSVVAARAGNPLVREDSSHDTASTHSSTSTVSLRRVVRKHSRSTMSVAERFDEKLFEVGSATVALLSCSLASSTADTTTQQTNTQLSRILTYLGRCDGRLLNVCGTAVLLSWGVMSPCVGHVEGALRFVNMAVSGTPHELHCGMCCGKALSGYIGTKGQRFVTAVGPCVQLGFAAFSRAQVEDRRVLLATADDTVASAVTTRGFAVAVGTVKAAGQECSLYEVVLEAVGSADTRHGLFAPKQITHADGSKAAW